MHTLHNDFHMPLGLHPPWDNKLADTELPCTVEIGLTGIAEVAAANP